jgi:hypothetical protein
MLAPGVDDETVVVPLPSLILDRKSLSCNYLAFGRVPFGLGTGYL